MTQIKLIETKNAPIPLGHYSQATVHNNTIYVAGQLGIDPNNPKQMGSIEEQTEQCLNNLREILIAAGSDLNHLLKVTIYVTNMDFRGQVNSVYARVLRDHKPARVIIPVNNLPNDYLIEIDAIAAVKN
jgi:2-iminobutanoate/2-iminopropanoate deaminase